MSTIGWATTAEPIGLKAMERIGVAQPTPITADDVLARYNFAKKDREEQGLRSFIDDIRQQYDMLDKISIPNEYKAITKVVRTPFMRDTAQRVAASLVKDAPVDLIEPRDEGTGYKKAAAIGARWTTATKADMQKANSGQDFIHMSALNLVRDSESVIKVVHRPDAWANFPQRDVAEGNRQYVNRVANYRKGGVKQPFAARVVDRLQMVFGDGEYGTEWVIEYGQYPLPYLNAEMAKYAREASPITMLGGSPQPEEAGTSATWSSQAGGVGGNTLKLEYIDAAQWAVVVNGQMAPGFPKVNPYAPFIPYFRATSLPTLYALRYLVPALNALLTMKMNWAYLTAYPIPVIEALAAADQMLQSLPVGDNGEPAPEQVSKWKPGKEHFLPPGYTMRFLEPPQTGKDLDQMISEIREMIDVAGVPSVFRGMGGARQAGYAVNQLMAAATLTYRKLGEALSRQQEEINDFLYHCVGHTINEPVYVLGNEGDSKRWLGLCPEKNEAGNKNQLTETVAPISMLGPSRVQFRPILPTDEQADAMIAIQLVNAPKQIMSLETVLTRYLQVEDPQQEIDRIENEKALNGPELSAMVLTNALREAGMATAQPGGSAPMPTDPGAGVNVNDATNQGEPTIPGATQPFTPNTPINPGGRAAGAFPGQPGGPNLA